MPGHRPGACASNSQTLSDEELQFAKSHLLLADAVPAAGGALFTLANRALGMVIVDVRGDDVVVFALSPHTQRLYKLLHAREQRETRLLAVYALSNHDDDGDDDDDDSDAGDSGEGARVQQLALLAGEYLYATYEAHVAQYRLGQCSLHALCYRCASDPYCAWSVARGECFVRDAQTTSAVGWLASAASASRCAAYTRPIERTLFLGDGSAFACDALGDQRSEWRVDGRPLSCDDRHVQLAQNGALILLNVRKAARAHFPQQAAAIFRRRARILAPINARKAASLSSSMRSSLTIVSACKKAFATNAPIHNFRRLQPAANCRPIQQRPTRMVGRRWRRLRARRNSNF